MSFTILIHRTTNAQMIPYLHPQRRNRIDRQSLIVKDIVSQRSDGGRVLGGRVCHHFLGKGVKQYG